MAKLNSLSVRRLSKPGLHGDGNCLYLQISKTGTKSWLFRFMLNGHARAMGLGPVSLVSLAEARMKALECRKQCFEGNDPIEAKHSTKQKTALAAAKAMTFEQCAAAYIEAHTMGWKSPKHAAQWKSTLEKYANPLIGGLSVSDIDTALVMKVVEPIWRGKTETASRLRNRLELVLTWATVHGYRSGDNPARWAGHLDQLLPKRSEVQKVKHFSALPFAEIGTFMERLRALDGPAARGLEFCILTAARTNEVMGATLTEFNLEEGMWTIPASRMKAGREHRIPLCPRALAIVKELKGDPLAYIFPGRRQGKPLCNNAFLAIIKNRLGLSTTAHGFRSCFRDWCAEKTSHSREVVEMALAHSIGDQTEAAYRRGELLLKRRVLMNEWANYCATPPSGPGDVINFPSKLS